MFADMNDKKIVRRSHWH